LQKGQIYGNRALGNKVNNANPYWFSYPDTINHDWLRRYINQFKSYHKENNPNVTILEYLNKQPKINGKVVAFGA
jgi:hypothetical protein